MGLTLFKRALTSGGLSMTYKVHNPGAPWRCGIRQHSPLNAGNSPELNGGPTQQPGGKPGWLWYQEERQMGLTPLKRAFVSGWLPMTYKVYNLGAPQCCGTRQHSPPNARTKQGANPTTMGWTWLTLIPRKKTNGPNSTQKSFYKWRIAHDL